MNNQIKPSKIMWDYYNRSEIKHDGITVDLIISNIADVLAGYAISYSAQQLLKDLGYLVLQKGKKRTTKDGLLVLAHELHERYHRGLKQYHVIVNPHEEPANEM